MVDTTARVPAHLRRYLVEQDYAAYTAVDHAVWRFVLLQMRDRLRHSAHPAYARGLTDTGMSVDRIPSVAEMDVCLQRFGWGAVCVDGFIPPRAFQEFQALGILPIAAEIRSVEHLPYTPAPDIIHEAAGHAPILPDPEFALFLRRIGACGVRAFASARDARLHDAIHRVSVLKEQRDADAAAVRDAERALAQLVAEPSVPSEAARLSRLYWWTVEYGLVGTPSDYKLFGAGLLSSLGESYFCREPVVRKLALDASCIDVDYDITRPQPQLFVARDFATLLEVLEEVCAGMAFRSGGVYGLMTACEAGEVATIELDSGVWASGVVGQVNARSDQPDFVALRGRVALGERDRMLAACTPDTLSDGVALVFGALKDGRALGALSARALADALVPAGDGRVGFELASGLRVEGRLEQSHAVAGEGVRAVLVHDARVMQGTQLLPPAQAGCTRVAWLAGARVSSVRAGAIDPDFWPAADFSGRKVPIRPGEAATEQARRVLYERVPRACSAAELLEVHAALRREHPHEWLLRWNLLERGQELGLDASERAALVDELWRLEYQLHRRYPIAMGLRYLGYEQPRSP